MLIAQDSPFYLPESLDYLITHIPQDSMICGCVLLGPSPTGEEETPFREMMRVYRAFGGGSFVRYAWRFLASRLAPKRRVAPLLEKYGIAAIRTVGSLNSDETIDLLRTYTPDLVISIQADVSLEKSLVELAPKGCLSLQCALPPKYKGLVPSFRVLKNSEQEPGVSVSFVREGMDSGSILVRKRITIGDSTPDDLMRHTRRASMNAVIEAIELIRTAGHEPIQNRDEKKITPEANLSDGAETVRQRLPSP
jgi:methionyl-tRNA formyltransferase